MKNRQRKPEKGSSSRIDLEWLAYEDVFHEAVSLPENERETFVRSRFRNDRVAQNRILSLLDAHKANPLYLESDPLSVWRGNPAELAGELPSKIGPYEIVGVLGTGGMGVVYDAWQSNPRRRVALKIIHSHLHADETRRKLFKREISALARLQHPGIAMIFEAGETTSGQPFYAMERVFGSPLDKSIFPTHSINYRLSLFLKICDAVQYAHDNKIIHRDLKPANIFVVNRQDSMNLHSVPEEPGVKLLDFGLARVKNHEGEAAHLSVMTETQSIMGTLVYMSPEQAKANSDDTVDERADIYALGVLVFEMLTGEIPYGKKNDPLPIMIRNIFEAEPLMASSLEPTISRSLDWVILHALEKDRNNRYRSVAEFANDIRCCMNDEIPSVGRGHLIGCLGPLLRRQRRRLKRAAAISSLVIASGIATFFAQQSLLSGNVNSEVEKALQFEINDARDHLRNGIALLNGNELDGAEAELRHIYDHANRFGKFDSRYYDSALLLAEICQRTDRPLMAMSILEQVTSDLSEKDGIHDRELIPALGTLAILNARHGNFQEARQYADSAEDAVTIVTKQTNSALHADIRIKKALIETLADRHSIARENLRFVHDGFKKHDEHKIYLTLANMAVAETAFRSSDYLNSIVLYEKAIDQSHRDEIYERASAEIGIGRAYFAIRQPQDAKRHFAVVKQILDEQLPDDDSLATDLMLAQTELDLANMNSAELTQTVSQMYSVMQNQERSDGDDFKTRAMALICRACLALGSKNEALDRSLLMVQMRRSNLGPNHSSTLDGLGLLGDVHLARNELAKARDFYQMTLDRRRNLFEEVSHPMMDAYRRLAMVELADGNSEKASEYSELAHNISRELYSDEHPISIDIKSLCNQINGPSSDSVEALESSQSPA